MLLQVRRIAAGVFAVAVAVQAYALATTARIPGDPFVFLKIGVFAGLVVAATTLMGAGRSARGWEAQAFGDGYEPPSRFEQRVKRVQYVAALVAIVPMALLFLAHLFGAGGRAVDTTAFVFFFLACVAAGVASGVLIATAVLRRLRGSVKGRRAR
jgi:hypothetical protein